MTQTPPQFDFLEPPEKEGEIGRLGPYRITGMVGKGGMGQVFCAEDGRLKRTVALKVMNNRFAATPNSKKRFVDEARSMAAIHHDNVATIFEVGIKSGMPFLAMELLKGKTLEDWRLVGRKFSSEEILRVAGEVADGLAAAHASGIVHRDIKPANIWIEEPSGRAKILDFGLAQARNTGDELSKPGAVVGTPGFLAPEQARNEPLDDRTDLYSLGAVLYQMCCGKLPLVSDSIPGQLVAILCHRPKRLHEVDPNIPEPLSDLIESLLEKEPRNRPRSATDLGERVQRVTQQCSDESHAALQIVTEPAVQTPKRKSAQATQPQPAEPKAASAHTLKSLLPWVGAAALLILIPCIALYKMFIAPSRVASEPAPVTQPRPAVRDKPHFVTVKSLGPLELSSVTSSTRRVQNGDAARFKMQLSNATGDGINDPRVVNAAAPVAAQVMTFLKSSDGVKRKAPPFPKKFSPKQLPSPGDVQQIEVMFLTSTLLPGDFDVIFELQSPSGGLVATSETKLTVTENLSTGELLGFETLRTHTGGADSYVRKGSQEDFGGKKVICVHQKGNGQVVEHAYLKFDLSKAPFAKSEIDRAIVLLTVVPGGHPGTNKINVYGVVDEDWKEKGEGHLVWDQAPSRDGTESLRYLTQIEIDNGGEALKNQVDAVRIHGPNLDDFLRESSSDLVTLVLVRESSADRPICFSSKEGKPEQAPALAIRHR